MKQVPGIFLLVVFFSCHNQKGETWQTTKSGFTYHIVSFNSGDTIYKGDVVKLNLQQFADDSLLNDTYRQMPEYIKIDSTLRTFDYTEILPLMKVNDSAICIFPVATVLKKAEKNIPGPAFLTGKKQIQVYIKIVGRFSSDSTALQDYAMEKAVRDSGALIVEKKAFEKARFVFDSLIKRINKPVKKLSNGVYVQLIKAGTGPRIQKGDSISVFYRGMLTDGTVFETTDSKSPFLLQAGEGEAVEGLDSGIASLAFGDKANIFIPAHLAYGANKAGNKIPPFSNLVFEVQVMKQEHK
jgi:FKBP-type peptidyl-prolyl cis-trans isomerase FkpA